MYLACLRGPDISVAHDAETLSVDCQAIPQYIRNDLSKTLWLLVAEMDGIV